MDTVWLAEHFFELIPPLQEGGRDSGSTDLSLPKTVLKNPKTKCNSSWNNYYNGRNTVLVAVNKPSSYVLVYHRIFGSTRYGIHWRNSKKIYSIRNSIKIQQEVVLRWVDWVRTLYDRTSELRVLPLQPVPSICNITIVISNCIYLFT